MRRYDVTGTFYDPDAQDYVPLKGHLTFNFAKMTIHGTLHAGSYTFSNTKNAIAPSPIVLTEASPHHYSVKSTFSDTMYPDHLSLKFIGRHPTHFTRGTFIENDFLLHRVDYLNSSALTPVCFAAGTLIRAAQGDVAVEALKVGDIVITESGVGRAVRWLGCRTVRCRNHPIPIHAWPIRVAKDAFGPATPSQDLFLSPGHSICVDALGQTLIPAGTLVNGTTITQVEVDEVTYWHVELDSHDVIVANGLPAESYLDMGNRAFFHANAVASSEATPDAPPRTHRDFCRPFHDHGPVVDAVRRRLAARAEALLGDASELPRVA